MESRQEPIEISDEMFGLWEDVVFSSTRSRGDETTTDNDDNNNSSTEGDDVIIRSRASKEVADDADDLRELGVDDRNSTTSLVNSLTELEPAKHVTWRRPAGIWHHAIIVQVYPETDQVEVIHYNGDVSIPEGEKHLASVRHEKVKVALDCKDFYHVEYNESRIRCYSGPDVLQRAFSRLGEAKYNPFSNNCEHFARWCKVGLSKSVQLENMPQRLQSTGEDVVDSAAQAVEDLAASDVAQQAAKAGQNAVEAVTEGVSGLCDKFKSWAKW